MFLVKLSATNVSNDGHDYLVDIIISINVQTLDIIYVGIDNDHSWSIITPHLVPFQAMSLGDKMPAGDSIDTQQALANLAALAQISDVQQYQQQPAQGLGRQFSYPPENYCQQPPGMYGRTHLNPSTGNSWKPGKLLSADLTDWPLNSLVRYSGGLNTKH